MIKLIATEGNTPKAVVPLGLERVYTAPVLVSRHFGLIQPGYLLGSRTVYLDQLAAACRACNQSYIAPANSQSFSEEADQLLVSGPIDGRRRDANL